MHAQFMCFNWFRVHRQWEICQWEIFFKICFASACITHVLLFVSECIDNATFKLGAILIFYSFFFNSVLYSFFNSVLYSFITHFFQRQEDERRQEQTQNFPEFSTLQMTCFCSVLIEQLTKTFFAFYSSFFFFSFFLFPFSIA